MPRWILLFTLLATLVRADEATPTAAEKAVPPILLEALTKLSHDFDRWAYTETRLITDRNGNPKGETIIRFDPSKPYAEQYTLVKFNGQAPTERQRREYQKRGEKRGERLERDEAEGKAPSHEFGRFRLNGENAPVDLAHAVVAEETATSITYNVPLKRDEKTTLPVEKIELLARVNKERRAFENVSLRLRDSFRMKLVVKVQSGDATVDFSVVDPKYVPQMTSASGGGAISVIFIRFGGTFEVKRTEFQRVKPYSERFGVKIGPMKALDF